MAASTSLLRLALPLVKTYGFTRETLSLSVLHLPTPHTQPLSDSAVSSLFGQGDDARRTLITAWQDDALRQICENVSISTNVKGLLHARLRYNEPVLGQLPEAFALLASPTSSLPPLDLRPGMRHVAKLADEICWMANDSSTGTSWYARRASLAAIYAAAELHQMSSPKTAYQFLDSLLDVSSTLKNAIDETGLFGSYVVKGWAGIIKSSGAL